MLYLLLCLSPKFVVVCVVHRWYRHNVEPVAREGHRCSSTQGHHAIPSFVLESRSLSLFALCTGGIVTTLNPSYKKDTVVHQLKDTKAKYMAVTTGTLDTAFAASEEVRVLALCRVMNPLVRL